MGTKQYYNLWTLLCLMFFSLLIIHTILWIKSKFDTSDFYDLYLGPNCQNVELIYKDNRVKLCAQWPFVNATVDPAMCQEFPFLELVSGWDSSPEIAGKYMYYKYIEVHAILLWCVAALPPVAWLICRRWRFERKRIEKP
jgi:hypothetical protein